MKTRTVFSLMDRYALLSVMLFVFGSASSENAWAIASSCLDSATSQCADLSAVGPHACSLKITRVVDAGYGTAWIYANCFDDTIGNGAGCGNAGGSLQVGCYVQMLPVPPAPPPSPPCQQNLSGSIIKADSRIAGESVSIAGTPFSLSYFSDRVIGRTSDYSFQIPLTQDTVPSNVTSMTVTLVYLGRTETHAFRSLTANQTYTWTWDGNDSSGVPYAGSALVNLTVATGYNDGSIDHPIPYSQVIGNFKAALAGLGGWTLSAHHRYDPVRKLIYYGDGASRAVQAQLIDSNTHYMAANEDGSEVYIFDLLGRHLITKNGLTGSTLYTFAYDSQNRLLSITDAYSNVTQVLRNSSGVLTGIRSPYGQITSLSIGSDGYLATIQNPKGETYAMTYFPGGLLRTFKLPKGQISTFSYDSGGGLLSDSSSAGNSLSFLNLSYDGTSGNLASQVSTALSRKTSFSMTQLPSQMSRTMTEPDGTQSYVTLQYNSNLSASWFNGSFNLSDFYSPDPRLSTIANYTYSRSVQAGPSNGTVTLNRLISPSSPVSPFSYTSIDDRLNLNGFNWDSLFNLSTLTTTTTSPVGRSYYKTIDTYGKVTKTQLSTYAPIQYGYDSRGRLSTITQGTRKTTLGYNANGYLSSISNALLQSTSYTYDNAGRVLTQTLPDTRVINYNYDSNGNLSSVTPPGKVQHQMNWNAFDFLGTYVPPALGTSTVNTTYTYNNDKQLTKIQRPDGNVLNFNYDPIKAYLNSITLPSGSYDYTYSKGLVSTAKSADTITNQLAYQGAQVSQDTVLGSTGSVVGSMTFQYGNLLASPSDMSFLMTTSIATGTSTTNTSAVSFVYDNDNKLEVAGNETLTLSPTSGLLTGTSLDRVSDTFTYNTTYPELATYLAKYTPSTGLATTLVSQSFTRDALSRITNKTDTVNGTTNTYVYTYDKSGRLTDVSKNGSAFSHYNYDSNSNRTSGNTGGVSFSATYDAQDRLSTYNTKTYTYNLNGERTKVVDSSLPSGAQTTTYTYDAFGNLKQVVTPTQTVVYKFDGLNRRQSKKVGTTVLAQYLYEDQYRIGAILNASGAIVYRFVYGSKSNVPDYMIKSGTRYKILSDPNGSVRLVVNSSTGAIAQKIEYDEFGNVISDSSPGFQPFGFGGGLYDTETKLVHFGAREYDPSTGRWLSKDPILFNGGDTNLYGYVLNDPINLIDITGNSFGPILDETGGINPRPTGPGQNQDPGISPTDGNPAFIVDPQPSPTNTAPPPGGIVPKEPRNPNRWKTPTKINGGIRAGNPGSCSAG